MKATPITSKAKCSPFKMNTALVANDAQVHKGFIDVKKTFSDGVTESLQTIDNFKTAMKPKEEPKGNTLKEEPTKK